MFTSGIRNHKAAGGESGLSETRHDGGVLAVVAIKQYSHDGAAAGLGCRRDDLRRFVAAAIVDQNEFIWGLQLFAHLVAASDQFIQVGFFVEDWDNQRDQFYIHVLVRFKMVLIASTTRSTSSSRMSGNSGSEQMRSEFHSVSGSVPAISGSVSR